MLNQITQQARNVVTELLEQANMRPGSLLVIGCSSSEIVGKQSGTLIGMHLKAVAVPVRTGEKQIGEAIVLCAITGPKFIGGPRAVYQI